MRWFMEYNIQDVLNKFDAKQNLKYLFFWGHTPHSWKGLDLLGFALMQVRDCILTGN